MSLIIAMLLLVTKPSPLPTNPAVCVQYFHAACSQALGEWLPGIFYAAFWDHAAVIVRRDAFRYEGESPQPSALVRGKPPLDGTFFSYGDAGPPKGRVVYDYAHRIAFYNQHCCSWGEVVAALASPPPKRVVDRDLSTLRTIRGIRLGMSPSQVQAIYGRATRVAVPGHPGTVALAYTTVPRRSKSQCGEFQNFYFHHGRLVMIQIADGC